MCIYAILLCHYYSISSELWLTFLEVLVTLTQVFFCTKCCFTSWFKDKIHLIAMDHMVPFFLDLRPFFVEYLRRCGTKNNVRNLEISRCFRLAVKIWWTTGMFRLTFYSSKFFVILVSFVRKSRNHLCTQFHLVNWRNRRQ